LKVPDKYNKGRGIVAGGSLAELIKDFHFLVIFLSRTVNCALQGSVYSDSFQNHSGFMSRKLTGCSFWSIWNDGLYILGAG